MPAPESFVNLVATCVVLVILSRVRPRARRLTP